jgi:hypothetical protein
MNPKFVLNLTAVTPAGECFSEFRPQSHDIPLLDGAQNLGDRC